MSVVEMEQEKNSLEADVITSGSTWRAIWQISWPLVLNMLTIAVASFADIYVAGKLSSATQAAIGFGGQIHYLIMMLAVALSAAATALVSRFWGAGDRPQAIKAAQNSLVFALLFGSFSTLVGFAVAKPLLNFLGAGGEVDKQAWEFLRIDLLTPVPWNIIWICNSIFRARGSTRIPMMTWLCMTTMIASFDCLFCLQPLHLGVSGIALSALVASSIGSVITLAMLKRSDLGEALNFSNGFDFKESFAWCKRLMRIGLPACVQDLAWLMGNFFFFLVFARTAHPAACQAAWTVGFRVEEMFAGLPIYALSMAVGTIVGQNLGAGKPDRAERAGWQVAGVGAATNTVFGAVMFFGAEKIAGAMTAGDPLVVEYTTQFMKVIGLCEPLLACWLILFGAMQGAGYTKWPMWATTICMICLRLPLAWLLTVNYGWVPTGTWVAMSLTVMTLGVLGITHFKAGKWKYQKV
jgi:putative MATE family efflux protein